MAKKNTRNERGVMEMARERPVAAAAIATGAAAASLFLWSRRSQVSEQISALSDQIGEWTESMRSPDDSLGDDTAGLTTSRRTGSTSANRSSATTRRISETGGGNASLGGQTGRGGATGTASGRGRARRAPTT
jgi:hypothetical protein